MNLRERPSNPPDGGSCISNTVSPRNMVRTIAGINDGKQEPENHDEIICDPCYQESEEAFKIKSKSVAEAPYSERNRRPHEKSHAIEVVV